MVFPTHVGVFLNSCLCRQSRVSLPHARGGVSLVSDLPRIPWESSPRTWGCFFHILHIRPLGKVFPTHVGVFLPFCLSSSAYACLPHARGGVSSNILHSRNRTWSSPRTWGCFCSYLLFARLGLVFPTHVGVFPICSGLASRRMGLPHARGGVSVVDRRRGALASSSPRTWGCFCTATQWICAVAVFPTHVGVFLRLPPHCARRLSLPHARGGVSVRSALCSSWL